MSVANYVYTYVINTFPKTPAQKKDLLMSELPFLLKLCNIVVESCFLIRSNHHEQIKNLFVVKSKISFPYAYTECPLFNKTLTLKTSNSYLLVCINIQTLIFQKC